MAISVTFGTVEYLPDDYIKIPLTLGEAIASLAVSDFEITNIDLKYSYVNGEGLNYFLFLQPEKEMSGTFFVRGTGRIYPETAGSINGLDNLISSVLSSNYNTITPDIIGKSQPSLLTAGIVSVYFEYNRDIIGLTPQSFIVSGVNIMPKVYAAEEPDTPLPIGVRPLDSEYSLYSNSDTPRRYFRLDFDLPNPPPIGNLKIDIKDGAAIGYINKHVTPVVTDIDNLSFTVGTYFSQAYAITASEEVTVNITGLPDGITYSVSNNIITISGTPKTAGSGNATINVNTDEVSVIRGWTVGGQMSRRSRGGVPRQQSSVPVLTMDDVILYRNEDFDVSGIISGSITKYYVEGLLRRWRYDDANVRTVRVIGDAEDTQRVEQGIWDVLMMYPTPGDPDTLIESIANVNWQVIERAPVIINPGTISVYLNNPIRIPITISNNPSGVSAKGLLAKISDSIWQAGEDNLGILVIGTPDRLITQSENRMIVINASTSGGDDQSSFQLEVVDQTPPNMNVVIFILETDAITFSWESVTGAKFIRLFYR